MIGTGEPRTRELALSKWPKCDRVAAGTAALSGPAWSRTLIRSRGLPITIPMAPLR